VGSNTSSFEHYFSLADWNSIQKCSPWLKKWAAVMWVYGLKLHTMNNNCSGVQGWKSLEAFQNFLVRRLAWQTTGYA
jgi:hypothetical protein